MVLTLSSVDRVIPARGGSKRITRKNIKPFCGKPMIATSIEAALQSACVDQIVETTDDAETADVTRHCGLQVPFTRQAARSHDHTGTLAGFERAIRTSPVSHLEMFEPDHFGTRSQRLEKARHDSCQFNWGNARAWQQGNIIVSRALPAFMLQRHCVQDFGTPDAWLRAD